MTGDLGLLLNIHDGDDRCGCLRLVIDLWAEGTDLGHSPADLYGASVLKVIACLEHHPAGSVYRSLNRPVERSHGRTDGRTDVEGGPDDR